MASRASSEAPQVPALPRLGTSWYARGGGYWVRRIGYVLALTVVMAFACGIAVAMYQGFTSAVVPAHTGVANVVEAVLAAVGIVWGWVAGRRRVAEECERARTSKQSWRLYRDHQSRAPGLAATGRILVFVAAPVLPGFLAAATAYVFAIVLVRQSPAEVGARRELVAKGLPAYPPGTKGAVAG